MEKQFAKDYLIFRCIAGSHSYLTNIEGSDLDYRGVFIAPPSHILSCTKNIEQVEDSTQDDVTYELRKFLHLAAQANPNIQDLLWCDERDIITIDWPFQKIRENRHLFLSKKAKFTYCGFSFAQLKRIKGHKKWIMQPHPEIPPHISDFCKFIDLTGRIIKDPDYIRELAKVCFLAETFGSTQFRVFQSPLFVRSKLGFFSDDGINVKSVNVEDDALVARATLKGFLWVNLDEFQKQHKEWRQYWEWKNNRNPVRAKLEEKHFFDSKHAMHLVRLMKMCEEILTEGVVRVRRPDAAELIAIRNGKFSYDELIRWAEDMDKKMDALYEKSTLPRSADYEAIDNLYRDIIMRYWKEKGLMP